MPRRTFRAVAIAAFLAVLAALLLYVVRPAASDPATGQPDPFTLGTAIATAGYLALPALMLLGSGHGGEPEVAAVAVKIKALAEVEREAPDLGRLEVRE